MQRIFIRIVLTLVASAVVAVASAQKRAHFFIQVSDPQLGFISLTDDFAPEQELMGQITAEINRLQPDFVVFSGDLVHWYDKEQLWDGFKRMCAKIDKKIPVYYLPGNHDVSGDVSTESVEQFVERFGSDRFVHRGRSYTVIGYNSNNIKNRTAASEAEYEWIEQQLSRARKNKPIIVVSHHPYFLDNADEAEEYFNIDIETRMRYIKLFERYGVDLVLTGHLHRCTSGRYGDIDFVTAGPAGKTLGSDASGVEIVKIEDGKVVPKYYPIEKIPQSIR